MRKALDHWKAKGVDLSKLLYQAPAKDGVAIRVSEKQNHGLEAALDHKIGRASCRERVSSPV